MSAEEDNRKIENSIREEMIVEMLKNKVDMHIIAMCAKVSLDEIEKIAKNVN